MWVLSIVTRISIDVDSISELQFFHRRRFEPGCSLEFLVDPAYKLIQIQHILQFKLYIPYDEKSTIPIEKESLGRNYNFKNRTFVKQSLLWYNERIKGGFHYG